MGCTHRRTSDDKWTTEQEIERQDFYGDTREAYWAQSYCGAKPDPSKESTPAYVRLYWCEDDPNDNFDSYNKLQSDKMAGYSHFKSMSQCVPNCGFRMYSIYEKTLCATDVGPLVSMTYTTPGGCLRQDPEIGTITQCALPLPVAECARESC